MRASVREPLEIRGKRGMITMRWAAPGVLFAVLEGDLDAVVAPQFAAAVDAFLSEAPEGTRSFWDAENFVAYHSEFRRRAAGALSRHWRRMGTMRVLVTSPLVRMGVAVTSIVVQSLNATSDRAEFEAELAAAIAAATSS
jgi:hypothetical protein